MQIEEAIELIRSNARTIEDEVTAGLDDAYGKISACTVTAGFAVPPFAKSAMDGYAVRSEDVACASDSSPVRLTVADEVLAGDSSSVTASPRTCVKIMTGGRIPDGFDAVVKQEDTDKGEKEVLIFAPVAKFMNYCHAGEEIKKGETILLAGERISISSIGLLSSLGCDTVRIRRPINAAVISTGSELAPSGEPLADGKIYGSIRQMLCAALKKEGVRVTYSADCPDDLQNICSCLRTATETADVIITTGGVSVGKADLLPEALSFIGAKKIFSHVDIQPGTPTVASVYEDKIILSLSGNPYAALANFELYFPVLADKLLGIACVSCEDTAVLADPYEKISRQRRLVRARECGGKVHIPDGRHMSSVFGNLKECNCFIDIPADTAISPGDTVRIRRMRFI